MMHGEHYKINGWTAAPRWETFHHPPPQSVSSMSTRIRSFAVLSMLVPALAAAQTAPVATAFKANAATMSKNLIAAAQAMPADKYGFKPTPAQMSFGEIVVHLAGGNDVLCS